MRRHNIMEISTISNARRSIPSVEVKNAYKSYSNDTKVLNGLNMTVPRGKIYALLGSSGCGKSTLLSCIMGQCDLDCGTITLNDLCLYQEFSIYENMLVFGYLNGMRKDKIIAKADELTNLFELPPGDKYLNTLSGGQQRRVSIMIAFLHDPSIVILDEPTVGVDLNLAQVIWDYFVRQAVSGQTLIITTHYIQEAHKAHMVGLLRKGVMIAEDNPQSLMRSYECANLEDVFLKLSENQEMQKPRHVGRKESDYPPCGIQQKKPYFVEDTNKLSAKRMKSILYKDFVKLSRNYTFLVVVMLSPFLHVLIFHFTYGRQPKDLKIGFVNEDISFYDCDRTNMFYGGCILLEERLNPSCIFMDLFRNQTYKLIEYSDERSAVDAVKKNDVWAALHFPKNYTRSLATAVRQNGTEARQTMRSSLINAWVDLSSHYLGKLVKDDILKNYNKHLKIVLKQCGLSQKLSDYPSGVSFQPPLNVAGNLDSATMNTALSSLLVSMCICFSSFTAAMIGTGLSLYEFLISVFVMQVILHLFRVYIALTVYYWILGYTQRGNLLYLTLLLILLGFVGVLFGLISTIITTKPTVTMMLQNALGYGISFCSGLMWPIEGQSFVLRFFNEAFPVKWSVLAAKGITLQNLPFTNKIVWEGFGMATVWSAILCVTVGLILMYRSQALTGK